MWCAILMLQGVPEENLGFQLEEADVGRTVEIYALRWNAPGACNL